MLEGYGKTKKAEHAFSGALRVRTVRFNTKTVTRQLPRATRVGDLGEYEDAMKHYAEFTALFDFYDFSRETETATAVVAAMTEATGSSDCVVQSLCPCWISV